MADMNYVSPLTSDLTDYYTKSEVDELQQGDAATYATSAEIVAGDNAVKGWVVSQGFLTEHQDLTNYATISYVDDAIAAIEPSSGGMAVRVVNTLPAVGEENVLYLVFVDNEDEDNRYAEYVWVDTLNDYEMLGFSSSEGGIIPDLTDYATKQWVEAKGYLVSDNLIGYATVSDLADFATKDYVDDELANKANTADLAAVATSGDYDDLSNKPTIPSLTGYATEAYVNSAVGAIRARDVAYDNTTSGLTADTVQNAINEVNDKVEAIDVPAAPDLSPYATKAELSAKANTADLAAVATTGSYNDLSNKPAIPTVPANVSAFTNDAGYLTAHQDISGKADTADLATVAFSGDYDDLANKPSIPSTSGLASESYVDNAIAAIKGSDIDNDMNWIDEGMAAAKAIDEINNNVSAAGLSGDYDDLINKPTIPVLPTLATVATSGSYNDLTDKPTIPAAPDLTPYATKQELTAKADAASLASVATSGDYDDLTNKPTIPVLPTLATVATSGSYNDLSDKPTIPETYIGMDSWVMLVNSLDSAGVQFSDYVVVSSAEDFKEKFEAGYICKGDSNTNYTITYSENWKGINMSNQGATNFYSILPSNTINVNNRSYVWRCGKKYYAAISTDQTTDIDGVLKDIFYNLTSERFKHYSNATSGLTATTIQGAIDELAASSGGGITVQDVIDEFNDNGLTLDDGTANKVEITNEGITQTEYDSNENPTFERYLSGSTQYIRDTNAGTQTTIEYTGDTAGLCFTYSVFDTNRNEDVMNKNITIKSTSRMDELQAEFADVLNDTTETKTFAFLDDIPAGYEISETYDDRNKELTLSVVESSGM